MKKVTLLLILFLFSTNFFAQGLATLTIQGVVRDDKSLAVADDNYKFVFKIYDVELSGTALWTETHDGANKIAIKNGVYTAILGSITTFSSASLGFDKTYYVGVSFNDKPEMSPRIRLTAAPYALALQGGSNVFPSSGNVGVGTNTPDTKLHVSGDAKISGNATVAGTIFGRPGGAAGNVLSVGNDASIWDVDAANTLGVYGTDPTLGSIQLGNNTGSRLNGKSGNIGIGTTDPTSKLHVVGDVKVTGQVILGTGVSQTFMTAGDDVTFQDIALANGFGVYGIQDPTKGAVKLGSNGGIITGFNGKIEIDGNITSSNGNVPVNNSRNVNDTQDIYYRIVAGKVQADGVSTEPRVGFHSGRSAPGRYIVNFSVAFTEVPNVVATIDNYGNPYRQDNIITVNNVTKSSFDVKIVDKGGATEWEDTAFNFIAIGQR